MFVVLWLISGTAHAALIERLDGEAVYDTDLNITWLANVNLAVTNTFGVAGITENTGAMNWVSANEWIAAMNVDGGAGYLGISNWRLPTTLFPDPGCTFDPEPEITENSLGYNCSGSEMGHLFYTELGAVAQLGDIYASGDPAELAKFTNLAGSNAFWSGNEDPLLSWAAIYFQLGTSGGQFSQSKTTVTMSVVAVADGDVAASVVPIPGAFWLFASGLIGLSSLRRKFV
ncbi:MAG: hypothetical protein DRR42_21760 [Gammaproteobacteria bacterium]|nr:MAG: hypothetical protein DRR42_21760 [Gammaproteobacteria bacterium]